MADKSKIEWTDATWNPITGCSLVSPGCTRCYAMRLAGTRLRHHPSRKGLTLDTPAGPVWNGQVRFNEQWLYQPLRWKKPRRIFVCAHSDLFHENVPDGWIMRIFDVMFRSHLHSFQVLTKRPKRMRDFLDRWGDTTGEDLGSFKSAYGPEEVRKSHPSPRGQLFASMLEAMGDPPEGCGYPFFDWMQGMIGYPDWPANVLWGTSVENQKAALDRLPYMMSLTCGIPWWISVEPLLAETDLGEGALRATSWVVVGGESGPGHRYMDPSWARMLRDQCHVAGTPFFMKQMSGKQPIPSDLLVRQYPGDC